MTTTIASTDIVVSVEPLFTETEGVALAGFLAGYSGLTRDANSLDLRILSAWCQQHGLHLFQARRADIECFGREMETRGRARATVARRLCTIAGFYRYAVEEELLEHSPAVHVRRPRLDYESHAIALDRNEVGSLLVAAGLGAPNEHALISLLDINRLRISEALGADIEALGIERGHRTLTVLRNGGKIVTIPLAPRTARAIDLAIGERADGPIFLRSDGQRMDRHCPSRIVRRVARRAGVDKPIGPHTLRHAFIDDQAADAAILGQEVDDLRAALFDKQRAPTLRCRALRCREDRVDSLMETRRSARRATPCAPRADDPSGLLRNLDAVRAALARVGGQRWRVSRSQLIPSLNVVAPVGLSGRVNRSMPSLSGRCVMLCQS